MRWERRARRAIAIAAVLLGLVAVPLALLLGVTWLQGDRLVVVESGSMAPTYPVGSLLVVSPVRAAEVEAGDPITFVDREAGGALVTHRVVRVLDGPTTEGLTFVTRGDANAADDGDPVPAAAVRGRVERSIAGVGAWSWLVQPPASVVVLVLLPLLLLGADAWLERRLRDPGTPTPAPAVPDPAGGPTGDFDLGTVSG